MTTTQKTIALIAAALIGAIISWCWCTYKSPSCPNQAQVDSLKHTLDSIVTTMNTGGGSCCDNDSVPAGDAVNGQLVSIGEFTTLKNAYETSHMEPNHTWGGKIGKIQMLALIKSIRPEDDFMWFHFATDPISHKTSVMFEGGNIRNCFVPKNPVAGNRLIYRNAGDAYCPNMCETE